MKMGHEEVFLRKKAGKHCSWRHDWNNGFKDLCTISNISAMPLNPFRVSLYWISLKGRRQHWAGWAQIDRSMQRIRKHNWHWHLLLQRLCSLPNLILPLCHLRLCLCLYLLPSSYVVFSCPFLYDNYMSFPSLALAVVINRGHCEQVWLKCLLVSMCGWNRSVDPQPALAPVFIKLFCQNEPICSHGVVMKKELVLPQGQTLKPNKDRTVQS